MGQEIKISVADVGRLMHIVSEIAESNGCSTEEAVERIAGMAIPVKGTPPGKTTRTKIADFIYQIRRLRLRRNELIGAPLFRDAAWDMLLELYVAQHRGHKISVSSLCYASGVPPTTALRQVFRLEKYGLVEREGDRNDNRRYFVRLTDCGVTRMAKLAEMILDQTQTAAAS